MLAASALSLGFALVSPRFPSRPLLAPGSQQRCCRAARCQEEPLPLGWQAQTDEASGNVYYVDTINRVSQWEVPTGPAVPAAAAADTPSSPGEGDSTLLWGMISAEENPYRRSKTQRIKAKFGEDAPNVLTDAQLSRKAALEEGLAADVAMFKAEEERKRGPVDEAAGDTLIQKVIDTLGTVLTYNFFIIISFFAWFLTGVAAQFGAQQTAIIDAFRSAWDPLIMPLLTTHMTLTFLSAGLERVGGTKEAA